MKRTLSYIFIILLFISCGDESEECIFFNEIEGSNCVAEDVLNLCTQVACGSNIGAFTLGFEGQNCSDINCSSFECESIRISALGNEIFEGPIVFTDVDLEERGEEFTELVIFGLIEVNSELVEFQCVNFD